MSHVVFFGLGMVLGTSVAAVILLPYLGQQRTYIRRQKQFIRALAQANQELQQARARDNYFAAQESHLDLVIQRHRR